MNKVQVYEEKVNQGLIDCEVFDYIQAEMESLPQAKTIVRHLFTPGLYTRECVMPAGAHIMSEIHNTKHPYFVLCGKAAVVTDSGKVVEWIIGPCKGITYPGTRRLFRIVEDMVLITVHATDIVPADESQEAYDAAVLAVSEQILTKHKNKFLKERTT
jgi:hypothetical protein